jgi:hypothetical protein
MVEKMAALMGATTDILIRILEVMMGIMVRTMGVVMRMTAEVMPTMMVVSDLQEVSFVQMDAGKRRKRNVMIVIVGFAMIAMIITDVELEGINLLNC